MEHVRLKAEEDAEAELFRQYGSDPDRMVSDMQREAMISLNVAQYLMDVRTMQSSLMNEGSGTGPDPIVALKEQELQMRAQNDQMDNQIEQQRLALEQQKAQDVMAANQARIQSQENIAMLRADMAKQRLAQVDRQQNVSRMEARQNATQNR
jgi:hypothetical protein